MNDLPPRVELLRRELVQAIPCKPAARAELESMHLSDLMGVYVNWVVRLVPPRRRNVTFAHGFWTEKALAQEKAIYNLVEQIRLGACLDPFLSKKVRTDGFVPRPAGKRKGIEWGGKDFVLNILDVHHLHLDARHGDTLLYGFFYPNDAHFVLLGGHKSFDDGSLEEAVVATRADHGHLTLRGIMPPAESFTPQERRRLARYGVSTVAQVGGRMVIGAAPTTAGTSIRHGQCADGILRCLRETEPKLDDPAFLGRLCADIPLKVTDPVWSLHYTDLGICQRGRETDGIVVVRKGLL
ncbi:MAG TPA: hypothetical protein VG889_01205 [Rhizomicrobium sp.]|nr:hypothetical protein [Rhizomicrobium sp.]